MTGFAHDHGAPASVEWYTPPWLLSRLGLEYDLDPCAPAPPAAPWLPVARRYSLPQDGLTLPWEGRVWLNPPYGGESGRWLGRLAEHGDGLALVFARTDARWFQHGAELADALCFLRGRVDFAPGAPELLKPGRSNNNAGAPSVLLAFGAHCAGALAEADLGLLMSIDTGARRQLRLLGR